MIASILPMIFINSIVNNIDTMDDVTYSNTYMLGSIWYDVDIDYVTSMIPSTNSIDDIDSTIDELRKKNWGQGMKKRKWVVHMDLSLQVYTFIFVTF